MAQTFVSCRSNDPIFYENKLATICYKNSVYVPGKKKKNKPTTKPTKKKPKQKKREAEKGYRPRAKGKHIFT